MFKHENHSEADYFTRNPGVSDVASWKTTSRGTATCANDNCAHRTGTYLGKQRTGRDFDYSSAIVKRMVHDGRAVYCTDTACQKVQDRESARKRKQKELLARKKVPVQQSGR